MYSAVDRVADAAVPCMCCQDDANIIVMMVCAICCRWRSLDGEGYWRASDSEEICVGS